MIGEKIKVGRPGKKPVIVSGLWTGTAETTNYLCRRLPAALVVDDKGRTWAILQLAGNDFEADQWWDARIVGSREWETQDGAALEDVAPDIARHVDDVLSNITSQHEDAYNELNRRLAEGKYFLTHEDKDG